MSEQEANVTNFQPSKEPTLSNYLEQAASRVEALEKNLFRLKQIAVKLAGDSPEENRIAPETPEPTTFIDRAKNLQQDLNLIDRDITVAINRIESALG
jgi:hypothetical protein